MSLQPSEFPHVGLCPTLEPGKNADQSGANTGKEAGKNADQSSARRQLEPGKSADQSPAKRGLSKEPGADEAVKGKNGLALDIVAPDARVHNGSDKAFAKRGKDESDSPHDEGNSRHATTERLRAILRADPYVR